MILNLKRTREDLANFHFSKLFIEELGWSQPTSSKVSPMICGELSYTRNQVAQLAGVVVFEIKSEDGKVPNAKIRAYLHKEISSLHFENILIFVDKQRTQSLWYWAKRKDGRTLPRDHTYIRGQSGDLFLSKLNSMVFDIGDFDDSGNVPLVEVTNRLKIALDNQRVTKKFYDDFQKHHHIFLSQIAGIDDERDRQWYASVLINRLMFIYFLQRKQFLNNGDARYLQNKLTEMQQQQGTDLYYDRFLKCLFFEGFAKPEPRGDQIDALLGKIKYLNGGLFLQHPIEQRWPNISIPDKAFEELYILFEGYSWNLDDTPGGHDDEINPDVLGYIFERYINQKSFGAYYTRTEITEYLCERTIHRLILDGVNTDGIPGAVSPRRFDDIGDLLLHLDASLCRKLLHDVLPNLKLLDPACGSAAFLVAAMKTLINIYSAVIGKIEFLSDSNLKTWLDKIKKKHPNVNYFIKKSIITENLFGVDIMEEATEIAKLRLFLALIATADTVNDLEPLPNIEFNILAGNSLIGLMHVDDIEFEQRHPAELFRKSYGEILTEKNRLVAIYRNATTYNEDLQSLRDSISEQKRDAIATLNDILLSEFSHLGIKYEQATWDDKKNATGKPNKRKVQNKDLETLKPFHWGFEFDEIINKRGGFDAIITNPPWEIFKPNSKEFFLEYSAVVTKNKMTIADFEKEQSKLLLMPEIREPWLEYLSGYPHVSAFYRSADQYKNQISIVNGKKAGSDINLYKLFTEQCFNLLRDGGYCGIVIPSGIYTDLGTKQLREMLFSQTKVTGLFCFENRKAIFEGVHRSFKFVVLSFEKGDKTKRFPTAFMRHDVEELERFPKEGSLSISIDLIRRLSPDSLSIFEFKSPLDITIAEKMLKYPLLGKELESMWNLRFTAEFHMTSDSYLFETEAGRGRLPLYEGKMIWQFDNNYAEPRYWVNEEKARVSIIGRDQDIGQQLDYQTYRLAFRDITSSTNERTLIASAIPANCFAGNTLVLSSIPMKCDLMCYIISVFDSFVIDWMIRQKVTSHCNMFYMYQLPIPRLTEKDAAFESIVQRAARLICTTPEFDDLAKEVRLGSHANGATDPVERAQLRAELDGIIAHLYGLTEEEFVHILSTFPLVDQSIKDAALEEFKKITSLQSHPILQLIAQGEGQELEFKETLEANNQTGEKHPGVLQAALKTIAAFLNGDGGTLLIGVSDSGEIKGLEKDYKLCQKHDKDGLELKIRSMLGSDRFKPVPLGKITITFAELPEGEVCRIDVEPHEKRDIQHLDKAVYVRDGNRTKKLEGPTLTRWVQGRA